MLTTQGFELFKVSTSLLLKLLHALADLTEHGSLRVVVEFQRADEARLSAFGLSYGLLQGPEAPESLLVTIGPETP